MKNSVLRNLKTFAITLASVGLLLQASALEAASIKRCSPVSQCKKEMKSCRCLIKLESGQVGDRVEILDEKANPIASGRIVKRKGSKGVVAITTPISKVIRRGYPVIVHVDSNSSTLEWAASFSYGQDE